MLLVQDELLGAYVFCKRLGAAEAGGAVPTEGLTLPRSAGHVLSTVSHFNLIHIKCHEAARRADSNRRASKRCRSLWSSVGVGSDRNPPHLHCARKWQAIGLRRSPGPETRWQNPDRATHEHPQSSPHTWSENMRNSCALLVSSLEHGRAPCAPTQGMGGRDAAQQWHARQ